MGSRSGHKFPAAAGKITSGTRHHHRNPDCPDIWELANGDIAVIGRDLTQSLGRNLPDGVSIGSDERLVVIPRSMLIAAKPDIPGV